MAAKRRKLRQILTSIPFIDGLRLGFLTWFCTNSTRFFTDSYRVTRVISPAARPYLEEEKPFLLAIYHGRIVGLIDALKNRSKLTILISRSRDGEMIARVVTALGLNVARGSPAHKALEGTRQLMRAAREGQTLAVAVDGPRGPMFCAKPGIIRLAAMTGIPIIPVVCRSRTNYWMWGWDRFMAPLWHTPMLYLYGEPIYVPPDPSEETFEELRATLEANMKELRLMGEKYFSDVVDKPFLNHTALTAKNAPALH